MFHVLLTSHSKYHQTRDVSHYQAARMHTNIHSESRSFTNSTGHVSTWALGLWGEIRWGAEGHMVLSHSNRRDVEAW